MSANGVDFAPNLTFVSTTGPSLDYAGVKAMRAHITNTNFARRRRRLVREYADQRKHAMRVCVEPLQVERHGQTMDRDQVVDIQLPVLIHPGLDRKLNLHDAFFINHLTQSMGELHLVANLPASDTASLAVMKSDWARLLPDPAMLDVSLYFARHVYAARRPRHAVRSVLGDLDKYNGKAIRSVRESLSYGSNGLSDSLVAAIIILTILDQVLGNIEEWKIHISGLLQIITIRSRNSHNPPPHWILGTIRHTILQGLLLFTRHDVTLLKTIEDTGVFDTIFSAPAKRVAYLILEVTEQVATLQQIYVHHKRLFFSDQLRLYRIIKSLETAIQWNSTTSAEEAFLTAIALAIKIFLEKVLHCTAHTEAEAKAEAEEDFDNTAVRLMAVLQKPEQQLPCSLLALCGYLESRFWQAMMGAIAAPNARTTSFYKSRLRRITIALALTSWHDASLILQRFFWIPSIFSGPCHQMLSEILESQGHPDLHREFDIHN